MKKKSVVCLENTPMLLHLCPVYLEKSASGRHDQGIKGEHGAQDDQDGIGPQATDRGLDLTPCVAADGLTGFLRQAQALEPQKDSKGMKTTSKAALWAALWAAFEPLLGFISRRKTSVKKVRSKGMRK